jgi:AcrR family transcriptional regulator
MVDAITTAVDQLLERVTDVSEISVRDVARRAGVGVGSIYDYFNGQDGVFAHFIARLNRANYEKLQQVVEQTNGLPLDEALRIFVDHSIAIYLDNPGRTRTALTVIARTGLASTVIHERDRFAKIVVTRILRSRPELDEALVERTIRVAFDAVIGSILAELWRPTADIREDVSMVVDAILERRLGLRLAARK